MRAVGTFHRLCRTASGDYGVVVGRKKLESELVKLLMPDAAPAKIEEATQRWFGFLQILNQFASVRERAARDSQEAALDDRVGSNDSNV
ncbi:MAG: hypothetical protein KGJ66_07095 [Alphaproteobacteria bacterium]|nr:hypothetical protein [Alphaproteobacteria bacterium]